MKENTKYHDHMFKGKIVVDEVQPWFDFGTSKPWDDPEIPWVLDNKVRRQILVILSKGPMSLKEIHEKANFSPKPILIESSEYAPKVQYQWSEETIHNHLMNLEWYNLIKSDGDNYQLMFPVLDHQDNDKLNEYAHKFADFWLKAVSEIKDEIQKSYANLDENPEILQIVIDKAVNKLYKLLKSQKLLPDDPNLKVLWAEQIRNIKFEEWVKKSF